MVALPRSFISSRPNRLNSRLRRKTGNFRPIGIHVRFRSLGDMAACPHYVRFTSESRHSVAHLGCPLRATTGLMHRSKSPGHSITLSAVASSDGGTVMPSALAVLRLITKSNLVGCSTGRSAGLAPFRILSTNEAACRYSSERFGP